MDFQRPEDIYEISVKDKEASEDLFYKKAKKKGFFTSALKEGWYTDSGEGPINFDDKDYEKYFIDDDDKVFFKPKVIIRMEDCNPYCYFFKTYDEAVKWAQDFIKKHNLNLIPIF